MIKHIVVPIDFSDCSLNALEYAIKFALAMEIKPKLTILNAYSIPLAYADMDISFGPGIELEQVEALIDKEFDSLQKQVPLLKEIAYEAVKINHQLTYAIERYHVDHKIDLIFMGTSGASGLKGRIMGSNTFKVITGMIAPVFVVPTDAKYQSIKNIGFANDYQGLLPEALLPLKDICQRYNATLHIVHIDKDGILEPQETDKAKNLNLFIKDLPHKFHLIEDVAVELGLNKFLQEQAVDLMVTLTRNKGLLEKLFTKSESKKMILHSKLPLLVLKDR
jgi:nucleotide-binding universal stress UspA family protein